MNKTALIFGASGLIGSYLLNELIKDQSFSEIKVFLRKELEVDSAKVTQYIIDFSNPDSFSKLVIGDELFVCLGSTISKAGSKENFRAVDYGLPVRIAEIAKSNRVGGVFVVSSIGAKPDSGNFYLKTKGEMERDVRKAGIERNSFFRPSLLLGKRGEFRFGEAMAQLFSPLMNYFLFGKLKKYRAIHAKTVASALIAASKLDTPKLVYLSDEIELLNANKS